MASADEKIHAQHDSLENASVNRDQENAFEQSNLPLSDEEYVVTFKTWIVVGVSQKSPQWKTYT